MFKADLVSMVIMSKKYLEGNIIHKEYGLAMTLAKNGCTVIRIATDKDIFVKAEPGSKRSNIILYRSDEDFLTDSQNTLKAITGEKRGSFCVCLHDIYRWSPFTVKSMIDVLQIYVPLGGADKEQKLPADALPKGKSQSFTGSTLLMKKLQYLLGQAGWVASRRYQTFLNHFCLIASHGSGIPNPNCL
jgi:hypothetical protein